MRKWQWEHQAQLAAFARRNSTDPAENRLALQMMSPNTFLHGISPSMATGEGDSAKVALEAVECLPSHPI